MPSLILFDIDGTLVLTGGAGKRAMARTLAEVFGADGAFDDVSMAGRTDTDLLSTALVRCGLPDDAETHARFQSAYLPRLAEEIREPGVGPKAVMPGVRALLDALAAEPSAHVALLTGNYRDAARIKLSHFALWEFFGWGAFGEESGNRDELARIAVTRAPSQGVTAEALTNVVVVGDTPYDVACAKAIGARVIGVTTGSHRQHHLHEAGADVVLADLEDTPRVLGLLL